MKLIEELVQNKIRMVFNDNNIIYDKSHFAGGLTNYNYIMDIHGTRYVIREPGGMTNRMIDRRDEKINNGIALELGLNSDCIYFDEYSGIKISVFIENSNNIALTDPCNTKNLEAVSKSLQRLHSSEKSFANTFHWQTELEKYEEIVREQKGEFFFDYTELRQQLIDFTSLHMAPSKLVPCHNDTVPENFLLDQQGSVYLIDWEYSGMNEPSWDVAAYILESRLNREAIRAFLTNYYGALPEPEEKMKIKCYIMAQDLLWTVWALIRHYNGDDFLDYCYNRYERFRKNLKAMLDSPDYPISELVKYDE